MTEQRRAVKEAASGVMNSMVGMGSKNELSSRGRPDVAFKLLSYISVCAHKEASKMLGNESALPFSSTFCMQSFEAFRCAIAVHRSLLSSYLGIVEALIALCLRFVLQLKSSYPHGYLLMIILNHHHVIMSTIVSGASSANNLIIPPRW